MVESRANKARLPEHLLDVGEVASLLRRPRGWVYAAVERGVLPAYRVGRGLRFDAEEIARWLAGHRVPAPEEDDS